MATKKSKCVLAVGNVVAVETASYLNVGKVVEITKDSVVLDPACRIYDTGRFNEFCAKGSTNEHEPFAGAVEMPLGSVISVTPWPFDVPREPK